MRKSSNTHEELRRFFNSLNIQSLVDHFISQGVSLEDMINWDNPQKCLLELGIRYNN
jgi:hypothetical protein